MTEAEWLTSDDPVRMLEFLHGKATARKLRLFACECCRRVHLRFGGRSMGLEHSEFYLVALEREADALSEIGEWDSAVERVLTSRDNIYSVTCDMLSADFCTFLCAIDNDPPEAAFWVATNANIALSDFPRRPEAHEVAGTPEARIQAALLRCLFVPFCPISLDPRWLTSTVVALATCIYAERAFDRLPILADALQDAGCDSDDLLNHLRGPGPHTRGCWPLDLVLAKQ